MSHDKEYWYKFYNEKDLTLEPSDFAKVVLQCLKDTGRPMRILDAGCGNGRDSYYLGLDHFVTGVDSSGFIPMGTGWVAFKEDDFVAMDKDDFNVIYSRFTFHSLTDKQQKEFIESIKEPETYLFLETRSTAGEYEHRHHGDGHFRNFSNFEELKKLIEDNNFKIHLDQHERGLAPYKDEDPVCIRIIAQKE